MDGTFRPPPGSVRNGTRRVEGAKVGSCGMSASGRINSFAKLSGNDGYLRLLFVHCGLTLGRRFGRTPIALSPANRTSARATWALRDPVFDRGSCLLNLTAPSSETTGFPFEREHWCRCQTPRDERVTQPPLRLIARSGARPGEGPGSFGPPGCEEGLDHERQTDRCATCDAERRRRSARTFA